MNTLEYNTERTKLIIPEYGRHIHQMIDQAVALKNKEERNKMAKAIIGVMGNLNPHLRDVPDFQHKLWAQLFIMSNFELDVDSPFEKPSKELYVNSKPNKLEYPQSYPKYRFYGNNIKKMIYIALGWEDGELKDKLIANIANHIDCRESVVFYDRGIHEITAYLNSIGKSSVYWDELPFKYNYDLILLFEPWKEIYKKDENRIENFSDAKKISPFIFEIYKKSRINMIKVPNFSIEERVKFILKNLP